MHRVCQCKSPERNELNANTHSGSTAVMCLGRAALSHPAVLQLLLRRCLGRARSLQPRFERVHARRRSLRTRRRRGGAGGAQLPLELRLAAGDVGDARLGMCARGRALCLAAVQGLFQSAQAAVCLLQLGVLLLDLHRAAGRLLCETVLCRMDLYGAVLRG